MATGPCNCTEADTQNGVVSMPKAACPKSKQKTNDIMPVEVKQSSDNDPTANWSDNDTPTVKSAGKSAKKVFRFNATACQDGLPWNARFCDNHTISKCSASLTNNSNYRPHTTAYRLSYASTLAPNWQRKDGRIGCGYLANAVGLIWHVTDVAAVPA